MVGVMERLPVILKNIDGSPPRRRVRPYRVRIRVLFAFISIALVALIVRLGHLQIRHCDYYGGEAARRRLKASLIDTRRGTIYDRKGRPLASDKPAFDICVLFASSKKQNAHRVLARRDPATGKYELNRGPWISSVALLSGKSKEEVTDIAREIIAQVEDTRGRVVRNYVERRDKQPPKSFKIPEEVSYHPILEDVPYDLMSWAEVAGDNFPGIQVRAKAHRSYPYKDAAAHIIGYTAPVRGEEVQKWGESYAGYLYKKFLLHDFIGRTGIERRFNTGLRGERGEIMEEIDVRGQRQQILARRPPVPGNDVYLTIDIDLQREAEAALGKRRGAVVLMDPRNGEVLALATNPRFDLNTFRRNYAKLRRDPAHPLINRATQAAVPPGSLFKVVTATAGLQTGKVPRRTTFNCRGSVTLGNRTFKCWSRWGHGDVSLTQAIEKSCNVYFFNAGRRIGGPSLTRWAEKFGLGSRTGIEIAEAPGNVDRPKSTGAVFNMSIGQGRMLTTPLQVARVMAVIANGGRSVSPHLLLKIVDSHGATVEPEKGHSLRAGKPLGIQRANINCLRQALRYVVTQGTASRLPESAILKDLGVAAKTGTAQTAVETENQAWIAGFAPYTNARICFAVFVERVPEHGGDMCVPIIAPVLDYYFHKWQVARLD